MMDEKDSAATEAVKKTTRRKPMPGAKQPGKPLPQSGNALNRIRIGDDE